MSEKKNAYTATKNLKLNDRYIPQTSTFSVILQDCRDNWDAVWEGFKLGYLQGTKAAKAESKVSA